MVISCSSSNKRASCVEWLILVFKLGNDFSIRFLLPLSILNFTINLTIYCIALKAKIIGAIDVK